MTVFVTGATGLIGSYVCRDLLKQGYQVRALKRPTSHLKLLHGVADQITWIEGDVLDYLLLEKIIKDVHWVIHAAAFVSYEGKEEERMYKINVEGTAHVVNACLSAGNVRLLHVSSVAAIGKEKNRYVLDETCQAPISEYATTYAKTKFLAELEVWRGITEGLPAIIINPSLVLGPGDWNRSSTQVFKYIWEQHRFYTRGIVNFVDVRDVSTAILKLMETQPFGERFILSAGHMHYQELFEKIANALGKKPPAMEAKPAWIWLAIQADRIRAAFTGKARWLTDELKQVASNKYIYENTKITAHINMSFRKPEETIAWCCDQIIRNIEH